VAQTVAASFSSRKVRAEAKPAEESGIPDVLASDVLVFALDGEKIDPAETDFREMFRAFHGINLAGKFAGLISLDGNDSPSVFRDALKDTDIDVFAEVLDIPLRRIKRFRVRSWTGRFTRWFKDLTVESLL